MEFDKTRGRQLYEEMLERLDIPLDASKATIENGMEVLFLFTVSEAILRANNMDITQARRKQMMLELIRMDEQITIETTKLANEVVKSKYN